MTTATWIIKTNKISTTLTHVASGRRYRIGCPGGDAPGALALCIGFARGTANRARREALELERVGLGGARSSAAHRLAQIWDARANEIQALAAA